MFTILEFDDCCVCDDTFFSMGFVNIKYLISFHFSNKGVAFYQLSLDLNRFFGSSNSILKEAFFLLFNTAISRKWNVYAILDIDSYFESFEYALTPRDSSGVWCMMADGISCNNSNNFQIYRIIISWTCPETIIEPFNRKHLKYIRKSVTETSTQCKSLQQTQSLKVFRKLFLFQLIRIRNGSKRFSNGFIHLKWICY